MKKYINKKFYLIPLLVIALLIQLTSACDSKKPKRDNTEIAKTNFIYVDSSGFKLKNKPFFPIMLNYTICFRKIDTSYTIAPYPKYENPHIFEYSSIESTQNQLRGHFKLIKELGFNTVRITGPDLIYYNEKTKKHFFEIYNSDLSRDTFYLTEHKELYYQRVNELLTIAKEQDIRVMLLIKSPIDRILMDFTKSLLTEFKEREELFAYDFFNEPLYFDEVRPKRKKKEREKDEAYDIVEEWNEMMREFAPNQLFTIGFSEPTEVFEWDPTILPVDFIAFHTYHPLRVPNEIFWYSKHANKPWMIGETSLPADDDSISYEQQRKFMIETYKRVINCGGSGFGWWGFQDVKWGGFEHDYTALMNLEGETWTSDSSHKIIGTLKPAAFEVKNLNTYKAREKCSCLSNYQNMLGYWNFVQTGKIVDDDGQPVDGAVIRGWSKGYRIAANTFTKADGTFKLYSNTKLINYKFSAPGMSTENFYRIDYKGNYVPVIENAPHIDSLENINLEYHSISYIPFLKNPDDIDSITINTESIFNFTPEKFHHAYYSFDFGEIELDEY